MAAAHRFHLAAVILAAIVAFALQGCGGGGGGGDKKTTTTTTTTTSPSGECKPMTDTDPCYKGCGTGQNCTNATCEKLGKIGCNGTQCELMGKSGDPSAHCMSPTGPAPAPTPACKPMTATDPCFEQCGPGMNCTDAVCKKLGKIGCNATQCELMGKSGDPSAHCMSPMGPAPAPTPACKPMTASDPCFKQCGPSMNCTDAVCKKMGKIGCNSTQCELMGKSGDPSAHCMSPGGPAPAHICKPMTASDPCFQRCGPGKNCTAAVCKQLGKIGCNKTQCELMGKDGSSSAHCMSPMGPQPTCTPMTESDPCFKKCGLGGNCTAAVCTKMGKIGCNNTQCVLMGKSGDSAAHCMSPMGPQSVCKPMTASDPCFKKCGLGKNCTAADCKQMGKIGCNSTQCTLMGKSGDPSAHCMSPMGPLVECKPMTQSDPCFRQCSPGMNCTAAICAHLGKIGCNGAQCKLMGDDGAASAHCMSPSTTQGPFADIPIFRSDAAVASVA